MDQFPYLFIDGGNLRAIAARLGARYARGQKLPLDWQRVRMGARKVFYYDAIPRQEHGEDENSYAARTASVREEIARIELQPGYHVRTGELKPRGRRSGSQQKMVDVQFAVDALSMAHRGVFTRCILVIGDLDFKPLVEALVDLGIDVQLLYPVGETNPQLLAAADSSRALNVRELWSWLEPEYATENPLPQESVSAGLDLALLTETPILEFETPQYGRARVYRCKQEPWRLVTDTTPLSQVHHLHVSSPNIEKLRCFVEDFHGIIMPPLPDAS